jgi:hypothetical protein
MTDEENNKPEPDPQPHEPTLSDLGLPQPLSEDWEQIRRRIDGNPSILTYPRDLADILIRLIGVVEKLTERVEKLERKESAE